MDNKVSAHGVQMIMRLEGTRDTVYLDAVGLPTVGVGHLLTKDELSSGRIIAANGSIIDIRKPLSYGDIYTLLMDDLSEYEYAINTNITQTLNQHQFDALVSWAFNVGAGAVARSTLRKLLNAGNFEAVPAQLRRWDKAGGRVLRGLQNRRDAEVRMWLGQYSDNTVTIAEPITIVTTTDGEVLSTYYPTNEEIEQNRRRAGVMSIEATKPAAQSKIVWTQLLTAAFAIFAGFGLTIPPEFQQLAIELLAGGVTATSIITAVMRIWFTTKLLKK